MNEPIFYGIEILAGLIVIPWCVWVSVSIFTLKQQNAVFRAEMNVLSKVETLLNKIYLKFD